MEPGGALLPAGPSRSRVQCLQQAWLLLGQCRETDQPSAALVLDLKQRGMLDDTLVVWGGEFGRTIYSQGKLTADVVPEGPTPHFVTFQIGAFRADQARRGGTPATVTSAGRLARCP